MFISKYDFDEFWTQSRAKDTYDQHTNLEGNAPFDYTVNKTKNRTTIRTNTVQRPESYGIVVSKDRRFKCSN